MIEKLKQQAKRLKKELTALYYAGQHPGTPLLSKILIFIAVGYAMSPVDLIPDFIPILGYLDDLIILPVLITLAIKLIPGTVLEECRYRAENEPLTLRKNWLFGLLFIGLWIAVCVFVIFAVVSLKY